MSKVYIGETEYFPGISKIPYEGPASDNPLAFKFYDAEKQIGGKTMREHLRFAVAYWHSFCADGTDQFGSATLRQSWKSLPSVASASASTSASTSASASSSSAEPAEMRLARQKLDAAFEFITKLGADFYCWHDRDLAPEGDSPAESERRLLALAEQAKGLQDQTGVKLLWGTANCFSHPRYMNGAATNPDFSVVSHAAAQVKAAIDATILLDGAGYVFWGGREGYMSLLNTDLKREKEHLGRFLTMARDYGRAQGFTGSFYIEPKPMEPTKHQYDFDVETVAGFLREWGLDKDFRMNIEANHAELAGHDFHHELETAASMGLFGSVDANRGDPRNGWDTDQFPFSVYESTLAMLSILKAGGFTTGGLNFDAHIRRNSIDPADLFEAHIGGMDTFALGLETAHRIIQDGTLQAALDARYASFHSGRGRDFETGTLDLRQLSSLATSYDGIGQHSGKQERLENLINQYLFNR